MSILTREKGKHLTREDRWLIQKGLGQRRTLKEIAESIGCNPTTVSKEVKNIDIIKYVIRERVSILNPIAANIVRPVAGKMCATRKKGVNARSPAENV